MTVGSVLAELLPFSENSTYYFFSTAAQCVAAVAGLSAALSTFHYQNLLGRIREQRDTLYEKFNGLAHGLPDKVREKYHRCRTMEECLDFWKAHFESQDKNGTQHAALKELYELIKQSKRFRFLVIRIAIYGYVILLPLGVLGTLFPAMPVLSTSLHFVAKLFYMAGLFFYFLLNLTLTRAAFASPWPKTHKL